MGPAQVVDSLRGSAPAPIGWARRPPGGHTREHAWTERLTPPPAPGASNQISQNLPIPQGRTRRRTLSQATTVVPPGPLLPRRWPGRSLRNLPPSPWQRRRAASPPETALVLRRRLLRATATPVLAARQARRPRWGIANRRRPRLHPAPLTCRVVRPGAVRPGRRPTQVGRPRASQPGSPSATYRLRSSACQRWERRRSHLRAMGDRRASERPRRTRSPSVDRRLRSKEARTAGPTPRPPRRPFAGPAPRPGVGRAPRSVMGRTRRSRMCRTRRAHR
jgi:hypothetical protein